MAINIISNHPDKDLRILSNLARTPFVMNIFLCQSVEGFLQGIKFPDWDEQQAVFGMWGLEALEKGQEITGSIQEVSDHSIYLDGYAYPYLGENHKFLLEGAIAQKFRQSTRAREVLVATGNEELIHDTVYPESEFTSLPAVTFVRILTQLRSSLQEAHMA